MRPYSHYKETSLKAKTYGINTRMKAISPWKSLYARQPKDLMLLALEPDHDAILYSQHVGTIARKVQNQRKGSNYKSNRIEKRNVATVIHIRRNCKFAWI